MTRNVGTIDRTLRLLAGLGVLGLYGALESPYKYLTLVGLLLLGTAITGTCPLYSVLGIDTSARRRDRKGG